MATDPVWDDGDLAMMLGRYREFLNARVGSPVTAESDERYCSLFLRWRIGEYAPRRLPQPYARAVPAGEKGMAELVGELGQYQATLFAGVIPSAVPTYIGPPRRFLAWLAEGAGPASSIAGSAGRTAVTHLRRASTARLAPGVPTPTRRALRRNQKVESIPGASRASAYRRLEDLVADWRTRGCPSQTGIQWPKGEWIREFPAQGQLFTSLPDRLDRAAVRGVCANAGHDDLAAERGFLAAMAWGFGNRGFGRYRTRRMLTHTRASSNRLLQVAQTLASDGSLLAYGRLGDRRDCGLIELGPAFGTKFLYFCQPPLANPMALIHDRNVADWFTKYAAIDLGCSTWSPATYGEYLRLMADWAEQLECRPDDLELMVFQDIVQGQWAR